MTVSAGARLGPYEILSKLGAGGMGEVWKARDTRLDRLVAIKTLPAKFVEDEVSRQRFEREAKTISQLNDPHICTLYDVGDGYLVMELLEGESLAQRLTRGPLAIDETLRIGAQIADALDRAHRAGIVHRDLKPGNVMLTRSGAKLLDFGLAKSDDLSSGAADGETVAMPLTSAGTVVGTFQYMAPEQLEGRTIDGRADIFALGVLLYEATAGRRPFEQTSMTGLIAAIVTREPVSISAIRPATPPALDHVVSRCLAKDPDARWQSAHDVAEELRWIAGQGSQAVPRLAAPGTRRGRTRWLLVAAATVILAAAAGWMAAVRWTRAHEDRRAYRVTVSTPPGSVLGFNAGSMALSPDGSQLAYAAYSRDGYTILLRKLSETTWRTIEATNGAHSPFWSPDSTQIGFIAHGSVWKVPANGTGLPAEITRIPSPRGIASASWSRDGVILFANAGTIYRVSASGGEPVALRGVEDKREARAPEFLPDGRHFLVALTNRADSAVQVYVDSLDPTEHPRRIANADNNAIYSDGSLFYTRGGMLYAQQFALTKLDVTGAPQAVARVQGFPGGAAYFTVAADTLVYLPEGSEVRTELQRVDRAGNAVATVAPAAFFFSPRISHDGTRIAVDQSAKNGMGDVWIFDVASGRATRTTFAPEDESAPVWGADDTEIFYLKTVSSKDFVMRKRVGGGEPTVLLKTSGDSYAADWTRDGKSFVAMSSTSDSKKVQITTMSMPDWKPVSTRITARGVRLSPDNRWLAYADDQANLSQVFVQPFPPNGTSWQVSVDGGTMPVWSRDGASLFFIAPDGKVMASGVSVAADGSFAALAPQPLFGAALREGGLIFAQYDVFPDGTFLLNRIPDTATTPMTMILHWKTALAP